MALVFYFDQLMHDLRVDEAEQVLNIMKKIDDNIENQFFTGDIIFLRGNKNDAEKIWNQALISNKDKWQAHFLRADRYLKLSNYDESLKHYKRAFQLQEGLRFTNALEAMGKIYVIKKEYRNVIKAYEKCTCILKKDYNIFTGAEIDNFNAEINKLRAMV